MLVRTPIISQYTPTGQILRSILTNNTVENTAVLAAVPHLRGKIEKCGASIEKLKLEYPSLYRTLCRYALRMKYESVPYKLFAGISECKINIVSQYEHKDSNLKIEPNYQAVPNIEGKSIFQKQMDQNLKDSICYINNTLVLNENKSYYSYIYRTLQTDGLKFSHTRRRTEQTEIIKYLKQEFSEPFLIGSLVNKFVSDGHDGHDVELFVEKLVSQQIIIKGTGLDLHAEHELDQHVQSIIYYDLCGIDRIEVNLTDKMMSDLEKFSQIISQNTKCFRLNKVAEYIQKEHDYQLVNLSRLFWKNQSFNQHWKNQLIEYQEYRSLEVNNIKKFLTSRVIGDSAFSLLDDNRPNLYPSARCRVVEVDGQVKLHVLSLDNILPRDYYARFSLNTPLQSPEFTSNSQSDEPEAIPSAGILHCDDLKSFNISKHSVVSNKEITVYDYTTSDLVESINLAQLYVTKDENEVIRLFVLDEDGYQEINARVNSLANPLRNSVDELGLLHLIDTQRYPVGVSFDNIFFSNTESYFPGLYIGSLIISPRCWTVNISDVSHIKTLQLKLREICNAEKVVLHLNSSNVLVDISSEDDLVIILSAGESKGHIHLSEYLSPPNDQINHEIIVPLNHTWNNAISVDSNLHLPAVETLNVDSSWVYVRMYCDQYQYLLVLDRLKGKLFKNIESDWFFIAYEDAIGFHLRLRIKAGDKSEEILLKTALVEAISKDEIQQLLHEYSFAKYKPEYLKYSLNNLQQFEILFCRESQALLDAIHKIVGCEQQRLSYGISRVIGNLRHIFNDNALVISFLRDIVDEHLTVISKNGAVRKRLVKNFKNKRNIITEQVEDYLGNSQFGTVNLATKREPIKHLLHTICNRVFADITFEKEITTYYFALRLVSKWHFQKSGSEKI